MFENLTDKLQDTFRNLTGRGSLSEKNVEDAVRDVRLALLAADVNYDVVKEFVREVQEEAMGTRVFKSVSPGQMFIKIVSDRLGLLMGQQNAPLELTGFPATIMMVGLHGSGKTTTSAKLAYLLRRQGRRVLLVAADVHRPAAIDQLEFLGNQIDVPVFSDRNSRDIALIASNARQHARKEGIETLIVDTAGRLQIDEDLVQELVKLKGFVNPNEVLLVADAALGQEAVSVASHFNDALGLTGIILTKLDGDARGGAALSMRKVTGRPIKYVGVGEKIEDLEPFYPDRMASRILGMGDVVGLVEKVEASISEEEAKALERKILKSKFDLEDFLEQLQQLKRLGGMSSILDLLPGGRQLTGQLNLSGDELKHTEAIIRSMTPHERHHPEVLGVQSRIRRISKGCGMPENAVLSLVKRFDMMRKMMPKLGKMSKMMGGMGDLNQMAQSMFSGGMGGPMGMGALGMEGFGRGTTQKKTMSQKAKKAKRKQSRRKGKR